MFISIYNLYKFSASSLGARVNSGVAHGVVHGGCPLARDRAAGRVGRVR